MLDNNITVSKAPVADDNLFGFALSAGTTVILYSVTRLCGGENPMLLTRSLW